MVRFLPSLKKHRKNRIISSLGRFAAGFTRCAVRAGSAIGDPKEVDDACDKEKSHKDIEEDQKDQEGHIGWVPM